MFETFWLVISFITMSCIILRPPKMVGIDNITPATRLLGSPTESGSLLNLLTLVLAGIDILFSISLQF